MEVRQAPHSKQLSVLNGGDSKQLSGGGETGTTFQTTQRYSMEVRQAPHSKQLGGTQWR